MKAKPKTGRARPKPKAGGKKPVPFKISNPAGIDPVKDAAQPVIPSDQEMVALRTLAQKMLDLDDAIASAAETMKNLREEQDAVAMRELPGLMEALGMRKFTLDNGATIEVDDFLRAQIPSESSVAEAIKKKKPGAEQLEARREAALAFLRSNKAESLIKNFISVEFGKGQSAAAKRLVKELTRAGYEPEQEEAVHPSTLTSWIKEQLAAGKRIPFDIFNIQQGRKATVSKAK